MSGEVIDFDSLEKKLKQPVNTFDDRLILKGGKVDRLRANLIKIISEVDKKLKENFRYNENTHDIEVVDTKKLGANLGTLKSGELDDSKVNKVTSYISAVYLVDFQPADVKNVIESIAEQNSYNPIKEFLRDSLEKSKECNPFDVVRKYLNVEDTDYNRIAFDLFFRGAIARVFDVGCQFDYCLDLTGKQGAGKTTFLREVFKLGYTEVTSYTEKDSLMAMAGSWAVNDDELVATNKTTFAELKQIITKRELVYRKPYDRGNSRIPVDFVFTRTTNDFQHLKDATGDRRFLPVRVFPKKGKQPNKISDDDLATLWGNYYRSYLANPVLYYEFDSEEGILIATEREKYKVVDEDVERFEWYLETPIPSDFYSSETTQYQRRDYYFELEQYGRAYKNNNDKEKGLEWASILTTQARDKVTTRVVLDELYHNSSNSERNKVRNKFRRFMDNLTMWEKKKVRIGTQSPTTGWERKN